MWQLFFFHLFIHPSLYSFAFVLAFISRGSFFVVVVIIIIIVRCDKDASGFCHAEKMLMTFSFDSALFDRLHRVYLNKSSTSVIRQTKTNNNSTPVAQTKEREKNRYENIFRKKPFFATNFSSDHSNNTPQTHTYKNQIATWHWIFNVVHFICLLLLCALHAFYAKSLRSLSLSLVSKFISISFSQ